MKIPENWKKIKGAPDYALSPNGHVYNMKAIRRVKRYSLNTENYSYVTDTEGTQRRVYHNNLSVGRHTLPNVEMRVIDDYPDYKVTPYGAVWKYRKTGRKFRGNPFLVLTKDKGEKEYARLKTEDGRAHWVRMEKIMEDAYPEH
jgi:hypothetical protein